jgi:Zn-dependent protease with chaperone function
MTDPTLEIPLDFAAYVRERHEFARQTTVNGHPDYAFAGDTRLRTKLAALSPLRVVAEMVTATAASMRRQIALMNMLEVGPNQFSSLYEINRHCARTLGIPVPSLFVESSPHVNAYTIATDDRAPIVIVSSATIDALNEDELRFVIGHECGHIHNLHGVYNTMGWMVSRIALQGALLGALVGSVLIPVIYALERVSSMGLAAWSRAGEITCDRAGLLCAENPRSGETALAKLAAPFVSQKFGAINPQAIMEQTKRASQSLARWEEATHSHPILGKRIQAVQWFAQSTLFAKRRPDLQLPLPGMSLDVIDAKVSQLLAVL